MSPEAADPPRVNLQPGELYLVHGPAVLQTILGSCVSATFWSKRLGSGALCHAVLPRSPVPWPAEAAIGDGYRYVDFSLRYLIQQFGRLGAGPGDLEIKLFGGADVLPLPEESAKLTVGALNCQVAQQVLAEAGLYPIAADLRGQRGRRIQFDTATGEVWVQRLGSFIL